MKQIKTLVLAIMVFLGTQAVSAQSKVAHINVRELMTAMPAMKDAQAQIQKLQDQFDNEYKVMVEEYQAKLKKYEGEAPTAGDAINETRTKEMQDLGSRIQQFRETVQQNLQDKELELVKPIMEKAQAAIQKVSKAQGFQYVFDATQGGGLLITDGPDLLADVKKELGIPNTAAPATMPKK